MPVLLEAIEQARPGLSAQLQCLLGRCGEVLMCEGLIHLPWSLHARIAIRLEAAIGGRSAKGSHPPEPDPPDPWTHRGACFETRLAEGEASPNLGGAQSRHPLSQSCTVVNHGTWGVPRLGEMALRLPERWAAVAYAVLVIDLPGFERFSANLPSSDPQTWPFVPKPRSATLLAHCRRPI